MKIYKPTLKDFLAEATYTIYILSVEQKTEHFTTHTLYLTSFNQQKQVLAFAIEYGHHRHMDDVASAQAFEDGIKLTAQITAEINTECTPERLSPGMIHDEVVLGAYFITQEKKEDTRDGF